MNKRLCILTDTVADVPSEINEKYDFKMIPYYIFKEGKSIRDDGLFNRVEFYEYLKTAKEIPTTSHPPLQIFMETFEELSKKYDEILYLCISSQVTKSFELANQAKKEFPKKKIFVFDTKAITAMQGLFVIEALRLKEKGRKIEDIIKHLEEFRKRVNIGITLDTLKYLAKGGRIGKVQALVGGILSIKPIITMKDGILHPLGKVRTHREALEFFINMIKEHKKIISAEKGIFIVLDVLNEEWKENAMKRLKNEFYGEFYSHSVTPVLAVHGGPGAWGIAWALY